MKRWLFFMLFLNYPLFSSDLISKNGTIYKDYSIDGPTPHGLSITYENGVATVPYKELPSDIRDKYKKDELSAPEEIKKIEISQKRLEVDAWIKLKLSSSYAVVYCKYAKISSVSNTPKGIFVENNIPSFQPQRSGTGSYSGFEIMANRENLEANRVFPEKCIFSELFFLSGSNFSDCVDGQSLEKYSIKKNGFQIVECWRIGTMRYETTVGSIKTIPHYTADYNKAYEFQKNQRGDK